ncbi:MAG: TonB-dependent receptor, partial [Chitinophagia bacterium]|nr:TonB-dependent receptor [Chitinophagia bacterium]
MYCSTHLSAQTQMPDVGRVAKEETPTYAGSIKGKLIDASGQPLGYATVTLLRPDSSVAGGDLSKDDGTFNIANVGAGSYMLRIESIGAKPFFQNVSLAANDATVNVGTIKLKASETTLKTANVVGEKASMELKVDKKVFNVEKNITSTGGSATDVLQNVPSVSVDGDGNVSLRGKSGVTILIDGKPATMLGSDVSSALASMPAASIESVEVITNPGAKYDAQGTGGIINIITKKDGRLGINGIGSLGAGTRDKYNGNAGINLRKGKWTTFVNGSFRLNNTFHNVYTDRTDKIPDAQGNTRSYHTYEHVPRSFNGSFNSLGITFDPNKNNSISITENVHLMQFGFNDSSEYNIYANPNQEGNPLLHQFRQSSFKVRPLSLSTSFDYKHKFKKKDEELNV